MNFPRTMLVLLASALVLRGAPSLPVIPSGTFYVTNYGAIGDGVTTNTAAIQSAIDAAGGAGGGTVEFTPGVYESGPLMLASGVNVQLDAGAELQLLAMSSFTNGPTPGYLLFAGNLHDVEISGTGTIDGQGAAWWDAYSGNHSLARPVLAYFEACQRVLVQNATWQNSPSMHLVFKGTGGDVTIQGITINTLNSSPNTDGIDLAATNCLVQNCAISDGDDNIAMGSGSGPSAEILITNCAFGYGHGVSVGSFTSGGVSNVIVAHCAFTNTVNGIRLKSDNDRGGLAQNLLYDDITMTNVELPIVIDSYYEEYSTPDDITPFTASSQPVPDPVPSATPIWRDITISNLTAGGGGNIAGIIWGRLELPVSNIVLTHVNISASKTFDLYNVAGVQLIDSQITLPPGQKTLTLCNAHATVSNSAPSAQIILLDGTNIGNALALYNATASTTDNTALGANPITLSGSALTVSNSLSLSNNPMMNFVLGTNTSQIAVRGKLSLGGSVNVIAGPGFNAGQFTLLTSPADLVGGLGLGSLPAGYTGSIATNASGQVNLTIGAPVAPQPQFTSIQNIGGVWVASGTGGPLNESYRVLAATNLALAPSAWTVVATNTFDQAGGFIITNAATNGSEFFLLEAP